MSEQKYQINVGTIITKLQYYLSFQESNSEKGVGKVLIFKSGRAVAFLMLSIALSITLGPTLLFGQSTINDHEVSNIKTNQDLVYVMMGPSNSIAVIDLEKKEVVGSLPAEGNPHGGALTPDGNRIYAASMNTERMTVVDTKTNKLIARIDLGAASHHAAIRPDGRYVYASAGQVKVIDTSTNEVVNSIKTAGSSFYPILSPDGSTLYVMNRGTTVSVIDTETNTQVKTIEMGSKSMMGHLALAPDGKTLYATSDRGPFLFWMEGTLSIMDVSSGQSRASVPVDEQPHGVAVSKDGKRIFVSTRGSGTVTVIDSGSERIIESLELKGQPEHVSITADGSFVLVGLKNRFQGEQIRRQGSRDLTDAIAIINAESLEIIEEIPVWSQVHDIMVFSN